MYILWQCVFWASGGLLFYTFAGYHLLMWIWSRAIPRRSGEATAADDLPLLSVVLVAHNEQARVPERLANLLASDYPAERLELLLVSDGSTDDTVAAAHAFGREHGLTVDQFRVLARPERQGKSACLNAGVSEARGEFVAFADARQEFARDTLRRLVEAFLRCPRAGAVSGSLEIAASGGAGAAGGVDFYWRLEKLLRHAESLVDSAIGCTGAVYAIRRELYLPTPADTLVEDVVIPMRIAQQPPGWRVLFEPAAAAYDPQKLEPSREKSRKRRTLAGNFQMLLRYPGWLLPWRNRLWWALISHKYLRLGGPLFLVGMLLSSTVLTFATALPSWLSLAYGLLLVGQLGFYVLALAGMLWPGLRLRLLSVPAGFVFLNLQVIEGLVYLLRRKQAGW